MPKRTDDPSAAGFGARLSALIERESIPRHGAGKHLATRFKASTVTANAWLNGEYKPQPDVVLDMADTYGVSFEYLYFGRKPEDGSPGSSQSKRLDVDKLATAIEAFEMGEKAARKSTPISLKSRYIAGLYAEIAGVAPESAPEVAKALASFMNKLETANEPPAT